MSDMPGRGYPIPAQEHDRLILQLRRRGWTYKRIGKQGGHDGERREASDSAHPGLPVRNFAADGAATTAHKGFTNTVGFCWVAAFSCNSVTLLC